MRIVPDAVVRAGLNQTLRWTAPFASSPLDTPSIRPNIMMFRPRSCLASRSSSRNDRQRPRHSRRPWRPQPEHLESRALLATFLVTNINERGEGSLAEAIVDANRSPGHDFIRFAIPGSPEEVHTIRMVRQLPEITAPVVLDGYTQPGAAPNTSETGGDAQIRVQIEFVTAQSLTLRERASVSTIRGLAIFTSNKHNEPAILLQEMGRVRIEGNYLGLTATGQARGQAGVGVAIRGGANNIIGGTTPAARNVISNNRVGVDIRLGSSGNEVWGNLIGTNPEGTAVGGKQDVGVRVHSEGNFIGGDGGEAGRGNVISGNTQYGIELESSYNTIVNNLVGVDRSGSAPLGNGIAGVWMKGPRATLNAIGLPGQGNVIAGNNTSRAADGGGVVILSSAKDNYLRANRIGLGTDGGAIGNLGRGVLILDSDLTRVGGGDPAAGNIISGNDGPGIEISGFRADQNLIVGNRIGTSADGFSAVPNTGDGVLLTNQTSDNWIGRPDNALGNLISGNKGNGIRIALGARGNDIVSNFIGLDASGTVPLGNAGSGILIDGGRSVRNKIGVGSSSSSRNVISGNGMDGVTLQRAEDTDLRGNLIGTDRSGNEAVGNGRDGIHLEDARDTRIGDEADLHDNVISANKVNGVYVGGQSIMTRFEGNTIGLREDQRGVLGNGSNGVEIAGGAIDTEIGLRGPRRSNVISANGSNGILVGPDTRRTKIQGNYIGSGRSQLPDFPQGNQGRGILIYGTSHSIVGGVVDGQENRILDNRAGSVAVQAEPFRWEANFNRIRGNVYGAIGKGIELIDGANHDQPAPVLTSATSPRGQVRGRLQASPLTIYDIDVYGVDRNGNIRYFDTREVRTNADGLAILDFFAYPVPVWARAIRVTATSDPGDTSELSNEVPV
ncbi:MAG: NosD domain-containing protein [Isosphaeraceae bacterium]